MYQAPKEERRHIEESEEICGFFKQSNISEKNRKRLLALAASSDAVIARAAKLAIEIATAHPSKRRRMKFLAAQRRDLLAELEETGLIVCLYNY